MKKFRVFLLFFITLTSTFLFTNISFAKEDNSTKTGTNVTLVKDKNSDITDDNNQGGNSVYSPTPAKPVSLLPQTGEIVTSFIFIILGLSVLIFILGIYINKIFTRDILEMELQL